MHDDHSKLQELQAKIREEFTCDHAVRELRSRVIKGGSVHYVRQCVRCGNTSSPVPKAAALDEAKGAPLTTYDSNLEDRWNEQRSLRFKAAFQELKTSSADEYGRYLASPEWRALTKKVMARARGLCEGCGENAPTEVHHLHYQNIGNEFLWELVAVCRDCHDRVHKADEARAIA